MSVRPFHAAHGVLIAIAAALLAGLLPVAVLGLGLAPSGLDAYAWNAVIFTLWQALLSSAISTVLGLAAGLALARRNFPGRTLLRNLLVLPMVLPAIVVVLALLSLFGAKGLFAGTWSIYGLTGILLAHVFFNAPLVARMVLASLSALPAEQLRLAAQLGFSDRDHFIHIDWPVLRQALPGAALLVFLLCAASYTIVLTLGGGPEATTLEVAIYQALRFDFDPARATLLSLVQVLLCAILGWGVHHLSASTNQQPELRVLARRYDGWSATSRAVDGVAIVLITTLLLPPLAGLLAAGLLHLSVTPALAKAVMLGLAIACISATLTCALAWSLSSWQARSSTGSHWSALASQAGLVVPPAVLATGWFILANRTGHYQLLQLPMIILLNSLMALPFCFGLLAPAFRQSAVSQDRLCAALGLSGWNRFRRVDLPSLRQPLKAGFGMAAILSLGDLAAVQFFGDGRFITLPALIYQQMGSYRMEGAEGSALILALLAAAILWLTKAKENRHA